MKLFAILILTISPSALPCSFSGVEITIPETVSALSPRDCVSQEETDFIAVFEPDADIKQIHCDCVREENQKFDFTFPDKYKELAQKRFLNRMWEKNRFSVYHLTKELEALDHPDFPANSQTGKKCRALLKNDLENLSCPNSDTLLSPEVIKNKARSIYQLATSEIEAKRSNQTSELVNRSSLKCETGSTMTESDLQDLKTSTATELALVLITLAQNSGLTEGSIKDALIKINNSSIREGIHLLSHDIFHNPVLESFTSDPNILGTISQNSDLSREELVSLLNKSAISSIEKKCQAIKDQTILTLCSSKSDNLLPERFEDYQRFLEDLRAGNDPLTNTLLSNDFSKSFCQQARVSSFDLIEESLKVNFRTPSGDLNFDPQRAFENSTVYSMELLCPYFPPPKENWEALVQKNQECSESEGLINYECIYVRSMFAKFAPHYQQLVEEKRLALSQSNPDITSTQLESQLDQYRSRLSMKDISQQTGKKEAKITAAFLGEAVDEGTTVTSQSSAVVETTPSNESSSRAQTSSQPISTDLSQRTVQVKGSRFQASPNTGRQSTSTQSISSPATSSEPAASNAAVYDEIRRRLDRARNQSAANPSPQSEQTAEIVDALRPPQRVLDRQQEVADSVSKPGTVYFDPYRDNYQPTSQPAPKTASYQISRPVDKRTLKEQFENALRDKNLANAKTRSPASASIAGRNGNTPEIRSVPTSGGTSSIGQLTIGSDLDKSLEEASQDPELARELRDLLENSFEIVHKENPDYKARVVKVGDTYQVKPVGNNNDVGYRYFIETLRQSIHVKNKFENIMERLNLIISQNNEGSLFESLNSKF